MYKAASVWHSQGEQLMNSLLEDDQEKTAVIGALTGPVGNYYGERASRRELKEKGYSPSQIEAASSSTRGKGRSALSGLGYQLGGTVGGGMAGSATIGSLAGAGYGGYRNYKLKKKLMLAKARELRGMDMEDNNYLPRHRKRKR